MAKRAAAASCVFGELGTQKKKMKKADHELPGPLAPNNGNSNNDIIAYEILPRLPAKSICRFKSVSKPWKLFLSTHRFGKMHHLRHMNNKTYKLLLLDKPRCCKPRLNHHGRSVSVGFNLLEEADPRFDLVLATLDGLVCVASTKTDTSLALWNPLTGAYYKLPPHPGTFHLPYNPNRDVIGFYSDSSNDYRLLYLAYYGVGSYIYSQRLNSWRKIEFVIGKYGQLYEWSQATFCDHGLYFCVKFIDPKSLYDDHEYIICFDVNTEDSRIIQLPPLPNGATCHRSSLVAIDGCIHLCVAYFERGNTWKLIHGDSWVEVASYQGAPYDFSSSLPNVDSRLAIMEGNNNNNNDSFEIMNMDSSSWFPGAPDDFPSGLPNVCITRNAGDSWLAIMEGINNSFEIMNMEQFTLIEHSSSSLSIQSQHTYSRIIYEETLVSPNPPAP